MKIILIKNSQRSLTEQLCEQIKRYALTRMDAKEEKLPSIRSLAVELGVSVITVKNAYEQLQADGFITSRRGSGVFLTMLALDKKVEIKSECIEKVKSVINECKDSGVSKEELRKLIDEIYE